MGLLQFLSHWWNAPFLLMLGLVVAFFILQLVGLAGHADHDVDADADVDHDIDHDVDHDLDHDADHDADADHDSEGIGWSNVLGFFGIGRVPFMVVWLTFFIFTGITGLIANHLVYFRSLGGGAYPGWAFALVLLGAIACGLIAVRFFSRLAARLVDTGGRGSTKKHELAGKVGVVASAAVDARFGEIRVRDERGNELLVHGRVKDDEPPVKHGARVVLVDFDPQAELFWVTAVPELDHVEGQADSKPDSNPPN